MSTSITNRLTISGNEQVKKFVEKLNAAFIKDYEDNGFRNETSLRRIIYSHPPEIAKLLSYDKKSKSIYFMDESNWRSKDTCITFVSQGCTIEDLQDYLVITLSRLDPWVLICNQSINDYVSSIKTRYSLMSDLWLDKIEISQDVKVPDVETEAFYNRVTRMTLKEKEKAFKLLKKKFNWIKDDLYL